MVAGEAFPARQEGATPVRLRHVEFRQVSRVGSLSLPGRGPGLYAGAGLDLPADHATVCRQTHVSARAEK